MVHFWSLADEKQLYGQAGGEAVERGPRVGPLDRGRKGWQVEGGDLEKDERELLQVPGELPF